MQVPVRLLQQIMLKVIDMHLSSKIIDILISSTLLVLPAHTIKTVALCLFGRLDFEQREMHS